MIILCTFTIEDTPQNIEKFVRDPDVLVTLMWNRSQDWIRLSTELRYRAATISDALQENLLNSILSIPCTCYMKITNPTDYFQIHNIHLKLTYKQVIKILNRHD